MWFFIKYKSCDIWLFLKLTLSSHFNCKMNAIQQLDICMSSYISACICFFTQLQLCPQPLQTWSLPSFLYFRGLFQCPLLSNWVHAPVPGSLSVLPLNSACVVPSQCMLHLCLFLSPSSSNWLTREGISGCIVYCCVFGTQINVWHLINTHRLFVQ